MRDANYKFYDSVPVSSELFQTISTELEIPSIWPFILAKKSAHVGYIKHENTAGQSIISTRRHLEQSFSQDLINLLAFMSRTLGHWYASHAASVSFNTSSGTISVYLHIPREGGMSSQFSCMLADEKGLLHHPGLVPLLLAHLEYLETDRVLLNRRLECARLEQDLGHSRLFSETKIKTSTPTRSDLDRMSRNNNLFASKLTTHVERVESALLRSNCICDFTDEVCKEMKLKGCGESEWQERSLKIKNHLAFLQNGWKMMLVRYKAFQGSTQTQLDVVRSTSTLAQYQPITGQYSSDIQSYRPTRQ